METDGIILGREEEEILIKVINEFKLNPTHWIYSSPFTPDKGDVCISKIFLWCPLLCAIHKCPLEFHSWTTKLTHQSPRNPRLVYDLQGNIILIQSIYRCNQNLSNHTTPGHEYYSTSTDILNVVPRTIKEKFPIKLFYRPACTKDLRDYVVTHIGRGQNFLELSENIGSMNFQAFIRNHKDSIDPNTFYDRILYSYPSNEQLMHMFLSYFNGMEHAYQKQMESRPCSILTCDHTIKVSKHVGVMRSSDNAFINQFENLFIALNEHRQVAAWRLTRSTAFKEVEDLLKDLKICPDAKGQELHMIMVDDCQVYQGIPAYTRYTRVYQGIQGYTRVYRGIPGYTVVHKGIPGYTRVYKGIQGYTEVYQGIQWYTRVYQGIRGYTRVYQGIRGYTRVYQGIRGYTRVYQGVQGYTEVYKGIQEYTRVYKGIQGYTEVYKGIPGYTRAYKGIQRYTRVYQGIQGYTRVYRGIMGYTRV